MTPRPRDEGDSCRHRGACVLCVYASQGAAVPGERSTSTARRAAFEGGRSWPPHLSTARGRAVTSTPQLPRSGDIENRGALLAGVPAIVKPASVRRRDGGGVRVMFEIVIFPRAASARAGGAGTLDHMRERTSSLHRSAATGRKLIQHRRSSSLGSLQHVCGPPLNFSRLGPELAPAARSSPLREGVAKG